MQKADIKSRFKFKRKHRLLSKQDFETVFAQSKKLRDNFLLIFFHKNQCSYSRLGLVISKQSIKLAVDRNRIRRVLRDSFRMQKELSGLDIIVLIRPSCASICKDKQVLRQTIDKLWQPLLTLSKAV